MSCAHDDMVSMHTWTIEKGRTTFYAKASQYIDGKIVGVIRMHQMILCVEPVRGTRKRSFPVDHKDHNGLNNQRENIRVCINSIGNSANARMYRNKAVPYKGVSMKKDNGNKKYCARIRVYNKLIHLGMFYDPISAAKAYNTAAVKYFGEYACINKFSDV